MKKTKPENAPSAVQSPPFWIFLLASLLAFNGLSAFWNFLGSLLIQRPAFSMNVWKPLFSAVLSLFFAYGLLRGKRWVRILLFALGWVVVSIFVLGVLLPAISSFGVVRVHSSGPMGEFALINYIIWALIQCVLLFGLSRSSSKTWCEHARPLHANTRVVFIILALLSFVHTWHVQYHKYEKSAAFPLNTTVVLLDDASGEPISDEQWREYELRSIREFERQTALRRTLDEETRSIHLEGVGFGTLVHSIRIRPYQPEVIRITDSSPERVEVRLRLRNHAGANNP